LTPEQLESLSEVDKLALVEYSQMLRRVWATENYADYVEYVHGQRWVWGKHLRYLCEVVQEFLETNTGNPYDILAVSLPPQHGKSFTLTETLPSYYMGRHPYYRSIVAGYNDELANRFGRRNRDKVRQFGGELFGINLAKSPNSDSNFELDNKVGACLCKGLRSGITGNPAELVIIDDPIKDALESNSIVFRDRVWDGWVHAIRTRLAPGAKVIIISTRWHEDDLIGRMLVTEGRSDAGGLVRYINLPCEAEDNDPLGREPGEPLFPEIGRDKDWLRKTKRAFMNDPHTGGPSAWYALYQGRPRILGGNMFKEGWFNFWYPRTIQSPGPISVVMEDGNKGQKEPLPLPLEFDELLQSWDCTFKDEITNDFVVGTVWGRRGIDYYLLDMVRKRMNVVDTIDAIERVSTKWPNARLKLIEDKANGPAVIQLLRNKITGLVAIPAIKSKAGRASATEAAFQSGHVFIPHTVVRSWSHDVINEFTSFPNGIHDDIVDSCVHALNRFDSNTANQTRVVGGVEHIRQTGEGWKPSISKPFHRTAKGRARVV
jgi:predicted phage terminase large subunit-like protein